MSTFNAEQFINSRVKGAMDTKYPTCPVGEYRGQVDDLDGREQTVKEGDRAGQTFVVMDVIWEVIDEPVRELLNLKKVTCRQSIFLDMTPENQLDLGTGKNVSLGKLREALGQNDKKKDWFPGLLRGAVGRITVEHEPNKKDPMNPYAKVTRVAPLS